MPNKDFFKFCKNLTPMELKAIGQYSSVQHMEKGSIIFSKDMPSDEFYIISRGVVEILDSTDDEEFGTPITYFSRGDVLGAVGAMTDTPRTHTARVLESTSIQRFKKYCIPTLYAKVPTFAQYLAEQLAWQLLAVTQSSAMLTNESGLSGNLENFDLVTIFQTILHSSSDGEMIVSDKENQPIARYFFENGAPKYAEFSHLRGEEAIWQLFLADLKGSFVFNLHSIPEDMTGEVAVARSIDDLLLHALQKRDELNLLLEDFPDFDSQLMQTSEDLDWQGSPELAPAAEAVWEAISHSVRSISDIYLACNYCEMSICSVVSELLRTDQIGLYSIQPAITRSPAIRMSEAPMSDVRITPAYIRRSPIAV